MSMDFLLEIFKFLKTRKKIWIIPIFLSLFLFAGIIFISEGTVVAPFIYTLF